MMEYRMTYFLLSLSIAGICGIVLAIWAVVFKKEEAREKFLGEIAMLTVATLLSLSIGLFFLSVSAKGQVEREKKVAVVRLLSVKQEALENQNRIAWLIADYRTDELRDIQFYVLETRDVDRFFGSASYYRSSPTLRKSLQDMLRILERLNLWIGQSRGEVDPMLAAELFKADRVLERCVQAIEQERKKMG